jgi:hypothetical protein
MFYPSTSFERQWLAEGRTIGRLRYRKVVGGPLSFADRTHHARFPGQRTFEVRSTDEQRGG